MFGCPFQKLDGFGDIGPCGHHVGRVTGSKLQIGFCTDQFFNEPDGIQKYNGFVGPQVNGFVTQRSQRLNGTACNIVHVGEITRLLTVTEDHDVLSFTDPLHETKQAHVGAAGRAGRKRGPRPASAGPASLARPAPTASSSTIPVSFSLRRSTVRRPDLIAIGSSTGGPQALFRLLGDLGAEVRQPILITQHMPATFTSLLASHISRAAAAPCAEANDDEAILPGRIYLAPGDNHMIAESGGSGNILRLTKSEPENYCRPAVDPMLRSLAALYGPRLLVIILTGMGSDGHKGAEAVVAAGGSVIAQDEASSVVWGMPGAVATAGLCAAILPLSDIAPYVRKLVVRSAA